MIIRQANGEPLVGWSVISKAPMPKASECFIDAGCEWEYIPNTINPGRKTVRLFRPYSGTRSDGYVWVQHESGEFAKCANVNLMFSLPTPRNVA